jgi:hypothetical protein
MNNEQKTDDELGDVLEAAFDGGGNCAAYVKSYLTKMQKEIERLRLTDAERGAIERNIKHGNGKWLMHVSEKDQEIISKMLERLK